MVTENIVIKTGVAKSLINPDLNFRLRLDIGGANIRIADKLITNEETGQFYVDRESGLDMDFEIVKSLDKTPNESRITIWNLSDSTYKKIADEADAFELYGAWSNDEYALMFRGYPQKAVKKAKGTILTTNKGFLKQDANASRRGQNDIETVLTLLDGKFEYEDAFLSKTYYDPERQGISTELLLKDCIETLGVPIGTMAEIKHIKLMGGMTYRDKTVKILKNLEQQLNFKSAIINGIFYTFTDGIPEQPYGIKLNSGNSSTPERQNDKFITKTKTIVRANKKKGVEGVKQTNVVKTENGFKIETKLLPFLNPGITCYCDFGDILTGNKSIYKVKHIGNNYGTNARTEVYVS